MMTHQSREVHSIPQHILTHVEQRTEKLSSPLLYTHTHKWCFFHQPESFQTSMKILLCLNLWQQSYVQCVMLVRLVNGLACEMLFSISSTVVTFVLLIPFGPPPETEYQGDGGGGWGVG